MPNHDLARWQDEADERLTPDVKPDGIYLRISYKYLLVPCTDREAIWDAIAALLPVLVVYFQASADVRLMWFEGGVVVREKVA